MNPAIKRSLHSVFIAILILFPTASVVAQQANPNDSIELNRYGYSHGYYVVILHRNGSAELNVRRAATLSDAFTADIAPGRWTGKVDVQVVSRLFDLATEIRFAELNAEYGFTRKPEIEIQPGVGAIISDAPGNPGVYISLAAKTVAAHLNTGKDNGYYGPEDLQKLQKAIDAVAQNIKWARP